MFIVTNTIRVKSGHGHELEERFRNPKSVHQFPGFVRMQLLKTQDTTEYEEYVVSTTWEGKEFFDKWVESDSFKGAHAKRRESSEPSNILGNSLHTYEVVVEHLPA
ncbi:antibiotic biosynthesis monooxygenase [Baia soyae]|uniref:Heme oxygenase (Staphylobilin-producing) n=1 Tax=Baia soyae TaxID=1544746 RepID=A0A4R2RXK3_9BACL|nr:antibiotic biosynthesis monooxygenase [Baia soyae]TCP69247.1 heme oxygenase (staphylobilin-producing) [Baia soyae]